MTRRSLIRRTLLSSPALLLVRAAEPANGAPLAHWRFHPPNLAEDTATGLQDAICSRTCTSAVGPGLSSSALHLDGYSVWLSRDGGRAPKLATEFTIQLWAALESYPTSEAAFINQRNGEASGYFFGLDPFGFLHLEVSLGGEWRKCISSEPVPRFEWTHLAGTLHRSGAISLYRNGSKIGSANGPGGTVRLAETVELLIGKTNGCPYIGGAFPTGVLNGLLDEIAIHGLCFSEGEIRQAALALSSSRAKPQLSLPMEGDPHRPLYHALPARAWTNEPHGLIQFDGHYHLFYQKNANGPYWGQINWGHMTSPDLLRWTDGAPALSPQPGVDAAGCWSGSVIRHGNQLAIIYTAGDGKKPTICLASSSDGSAFSKLPSNPIIAASPAELNHPDFRDPFVWAEGDTFYLIIGSGIPDVGGTALLYKSSDLIRWTFLRKVLQGNKIDSGTFWEMPVFFPIGEKHILIVTEVPGRSSYWIGDWKNEEFHPDQEAPRRLEIINHFLSPTPYRDPQGRQIVMGIIPDTRSPREAWKAGWAHLYSLPRVLSLGTDGTLRQEPLSELQTLRGSRMAVAKQSFEPDASGLLAGIRGSSLEIHATFSRAAAARTGLCLRRSDDGQEETVLYYDWVKQTITLDRSRSSINSDVARKVESGPFTVSPQEALELLVFLDQSVIEVFVNGRGTFSSRVYPTRHDSDGIELYCEGGSATLDFLEAWPMRRA